MSKSSQVPITIETLQALADEEFATVLTLIAAEEQRRIAATPLRQVMLGQRILTSEHAAQLAREATASPRYEWLTALFMGRGRDLLGMYDVFRGDACPIPLDQTDLRTELLLQRAQDCQAYSVVTVRYHPHPWGIVNDEDLKYVRTFRPKALAVHIPMFDHIVIDRQGMCYSFCGPSRWNSAGGEGDH